MLQQLFNAADTSIVGYFDSADALAAVGTNGEIIALIVTLSSGLSIGANILIASLIGQKKTEKIPRILHTSIALSAIIGILGLLAGQFVAAPLLTMIRTPETILGAATVYLRIYFLGYPFLLLYDFGSAILVLNRLRKDSGVFHLSALALRIQPDAALHILKIGIPSAIQGAVFCFANIFVQAAVNRFGSIAIAGSTIAMNFEYFTYYVITAFGSLCGISTLMGFDLCTYAWKLSDSCAASHAAGE